MTQWQKFWVAFDEIILGIFKGDTLKPITPNLTPMTAQVTMENENTPDENIPTEHNDTLLGAFCAEIKAMEGWTPGSASFKRNNPGNLRCPPLNVLAESCDNNFCVFKDEATGFQALVNVTTAQAQGKSVTYNTAAQHFGLKDSGELNLYQFFLIRDPQTDGNDPTALAERFGKVLNVDPKQFQLKKLLWG